jgi:hypothetical protein
MRRAKRAEILGAAGVTRLLRRRAVALGLGYRNRIALTATAALVATIGLTMMPVWVGRATHLVHGSRA